MKPFRPLLAEDAVLDSIRYPVLASPKIDGIRGVTHPDGLLTRSNKRLPNHFVHTFFKDNIVFLRGLDGELVVGEETGAGVMQRATSGLMSEGGNPDFTYRVFDTVCYNKTIPFENRLRDAERLVEKMGHPRVTLVRHTQINNRDQLDFFNAGCLSAGYEGAMIRDPNGFYKQGRSTVKEGIVLKVKQWKDAEGVIIGYKERMHNTNEQTRSELGLAKRSTHQAGMVGTGMLGAWRVRGINDFKGLEFDVGGFTFADARKFWEERESYLGKICKYKHFPIGVKDLPRFPGFLAIRHPDDMS